MPVPADTSSLTAIATAIATAIPTATATAIAVAVAAAASPIAAAIAQEEEKQPKTNYGHMGQTAINSNSISKKGYTWHT